MPVMGCGPSVTEPTLRLKSSPDWIRAPIVRESDNHVTFQRLQFSGQCCAVKSVSKFKAVAIYLTLAGAFTIPAHAATIIVSNTNDNSPGSLCQALVDATMAIRVTKRVSAA